MAEPEVVISEDEPVVDEDMGDAEVEATDGADVEGEDATGLEDIEPEVATKTTFLDYLRSPIVELIIGSDDTATTLYAHEQLLSQSPYLAEAAAEFSSSGRRIELPNDDLDACAAVLEYLYKGDYFPTLSGAQTMEYDSTVPHPDHDGVALLRHARVYTLAQRFGLPSLSALAHKKIHLTQSTAKGEIAYARFVYKETDASDEAIRRPVAAFWATRSHVLRHEAETEFKRMCLEFPQFGFDVLSLVLDAQEKRSQRHEAASQSTATGGTSRKRQRVSRVHMGSDA